VIINDGRNRVALISSPPGTPPDPHIHPDYNEWWISVGGATQWQIGQYEPLVAGWGDIVVAPAGYSHDIRPKGDVPGVRLVATHPNSNHDIRGVAPSRTVPVEYDLALPNLIHTRFDWLKRHLGANTAWTQDVVRDNRNLVQVVQDLPNARKPEQRESMGDEWWVMLEGEAFLSTGESPGLDLTAGDIALVEAGTPYRILTTGNAPSVRVFVRAPA
jgi:mannose-6-phosphate isomerase-like protein (cupin superfamily)